MQQKLTPRAVKSARTKQNIMEAAKQLLWKYGYDNMSIQQICQQAQVSTGTFYHLFPSKHELLVSIASRLIEVNSKWDNFDFEQDSPYKLAENYSHRTADLVKVMSAETLFSVYFPSSGGNVFFFSKEHPTYTYLMGSLEGFQKSGKLRGDISAAQMYKEILSCHFGMFYSAYTTNTMETFGQELEAILKRLFSSYMPPTQQN